MSTIKTNTIQPLGDGDSLKIRTNALDSLTVATNGDTTVRGTVKTNTIQPINAADSLKIRTNDQDSLTVATNGNITVRGTMQATSFFGNGTIPVGGIIMWSGTITNIPAGWALCDGQTVNGNTTPDLRDKFIVGASADTRTNITGSLTQTGGNKDAIVVTHTHPLASGVGGRLIRLLGVDPGHVHQRIDMADTNSLRADYSDRLTATDSAGSSGVNANLPPYYALAFIMRIL